MIKNCEIRLGSFQVTYFTVCSKPGTALYCICVRERTRPEEQAGGEER